MIEAVLASYGCDMSRVSGEGWRPVRCPFHDDKHASASVSLGKDAFKCHTCEARGNAVSLIMFAEKLEYRDAVAEAERISGQKISGVRRPESERVHAVSRWRSRLF